jgi:hypothetical protein
MELDAHATAAGSGRIHAHPAAPDASRRIPLAILVAAFLAAGCNGGLLGLGIAASDDDDDGSRPVVSELRVPRAPSSPARISFVVFDDDGDATSVRIRHRPDDPPAAPFQDISLAAGSPSLDGIRSDPGVPYEVLWDFAADLGGESYREGLEIELVVTGGSAPPILTGVAVGDDAPEVLSGEPLPAGAGEYGANVDIGFEVRDSAGDVVRLKIEFNDDAAGGFPDARKHPHW